MFALKRGMEGASVVWVGRFLKKFLISDYMISDFRSFEHSMRHQKSTIIACPDPSG